MIAASGGILSLSSEYGPAATMRPFFDEQRRVLDQAEFTQLRAHARPRRPGERNKLTDMDDRDEIAHG
jgi:hypothetical protein